MDSEGVDEDSIDAEALHAQIDLSMSFAQSLVSSWLEPQKFPTSSRNRDLEKELTDYMKRPPRLGVGASIPEGHQNISREAARLKGKLSGSKRPYENDDSGAAMPLKDVSDDEGESRAGAIKKKARPDPFDVLHKKKKKHHEVDKPSQQQDKPKSSSIAPVSLPQEANIIATANCQTNFLNGDLGLEQSSKLKTAALTQEKETNPHPTKNSLEPPIAVSSTPSKEKEGGKFPVAVATPGHSQSSDKDHKSVSHSPISLTSSVAFPRNSLQAELLKRPILNTTGPPPSDNETDAGAGATVSPKKKRRRKRKKNFQGTDGA